MEEVEKVASRNGNIWYDLKIIMLPNGESFSALLAVDCTESHVQLDALFCTAHSETQQSRKHHKLSNRFAIPCLEVIYYENRGSMMYTRHDAAIRQEVEF